MEARTLLSALHVEQEQNKNREQTKSVCFLSLNHNYVQRRVMLSDRKRFVLFCLFGNLDGFGQACLALKPEKSGNALYLWCPGLCKMEGLSGKQRNRKPHDDRGHCTAFPGSPQKAPIESSKLMHAGGSDFVVSVL